MTSEVCLMNRLAVVLAADSATTVTQWTDHGTEQRYFKGANKIFQLSDHHPIGLMIFDSAEILRVPWEIVVKSFRLELAKTAHQTLEEYAAAFFSFLERDKRLFPDEVRKSVFLQAARSAALQSTLPRERPPEEVEDEARVANAALVARRRAQLDTAHLPPNLDAGHVAEILEQWRPELVQMFEEWRLAFDAYYPTNLNEFAELGMFEVFKDPGKRLGKTGLVFAGFGEGDLFPGFREYTSCGIVAGRHIAIEGKKVAVSHDLPASLDSFAQTDMCDTFSMGISLGVYASVMDIISAETEKLAAGLVEASGKQPDELDDFHRRIDLALDSMGHAILDDARDKHAFPLRKVLAVLPVDEMAELAETLINLQSLKEKVTKASETVGGPVDVAIITRHEGLIWAKRKHFFDMQLNSRFAWRQQARLT